MGVTNVYESEHMSCVLGDTLRPGGFKLTDTSVKFCEFLSGDNVLDIGCGRGNTVEYLNKKYLLNSYGIDPSKVLLQEGKNINPELKIKEGRGECLPFNNESMNGVFAECTLSLMEDLEKTIQETARVLKKEGWFVITDVFARNPQYLYLMQEFSFNSCMRGLHDIENLKINLQNYGFEIMLFEDYTDLLKELMVKIVFTYGSMNTFWSKATSCSTNCSQFQQVLSKCKVGYFLLIAKRR
jgi:arsenite methyltransferase